jgi:hypothetical protein
MALRAYVHVYRETATGWTVTVSRDPATEVLDVDPASPATVSSRVTIPDVRGAGFNGPNASGSHSPSAISAASNAAPIVITHAATAAALGIAAGDLVKVTGVLGNLNANGTFEVTSVSGSTTTLKGSDGSGAYTSGGYIVKLNKADNWQEAVHAGTLAMINDKVANG